MNALTTGSSSFKLWKVALVLLVIVYLCNFFTPLRLTNDTIRYFRLVEVKLGTWNKPHFQDFLPSGYVWVLWGLAKMGILNPFTIATVQGLLLVGSLYFLRKLFSTHKYFGWMLVLLLLNWNTIKFTLLPLSEMQFLFFTSGCLYFYHAFAQTYQLRNLIASIVLCGLAIYTRTAGMSLGLALILTPLLGNGKAVLNWIRSNKLISIGIFAGLFVLLIILVTQYGVRKYLSYYSMDNNVNPLIDLLKTFWLHIREIGELFINIPLSKALTVVPTAVVKILYTLTGLFFVLLLIMTIFSKRLSIPAVVRVYLAIYFLMVISWPFFEVRFWFPIFPLLLLVLLLQVNTDAMGTIWKKARSYYLCAYCLTGIFSLAYYTWLSFDRAVMANRHDAGKWKEQYKAHFYGEPTKSGMFEDDAIYILEKYDAMHKGSSVDQ